MSTKRDIVFLLSRITGITRLLESSNSCPLLFVLNYHRVGDASTSPYDPGTFSCSADEFNLQIGWLKERYDIVSLNDAIEIIHSRRLPRRNSVLLTFDDGYRDNYDTAFPIMQKHGVTGTFFLSTLFVGSGVLPWWDQIAWLVKASRKRRIAIGYPYGKDIDISEDVRAQSLRELLKDFKNPKTEDSERFIAELAEACGVTRVDHVLDPCFLTWEEAREMKQAGMCFGSHTHSHSILGRLPYHQQVSELTTSKLLMEKELDMAINTLAYPVGSVSSFGDDSYRALSTADYQTAFSFYSGVNVPGRIHPLDVMRIGINQDTRMSLRFRLACLGATGRELWPS